MFVENCRKKPILSFCFVHCLCCTHILKRGSPRTMSVEAGKRERERIEGSDERVKSERDSEERVV